MLIIATNGRTGSTLLVHILNKYKDITIAGEIYGYKLMYKIIKKQKINYSDIRISDMNKNKRIKLDYNSSHPFYIPKNTIFYKTKVKDIDEKLKTFGFDEKKILKYLLPQDKITGCKMLMESNKIRYLLNNNKDVKIILLIRDAYATYESMVRAGWDRKLETVILENHNYKKINEEFPNRTFLINYKDILNRKNKRIKELFNFIGIKYNQEIYEKSRKQICSYKTRFHITKKK